MKFAVTFGSKYDDPERLHPASPKINAKSYVVIYSNPLLDPNPTFVANGQETLWDAEADARREAVKVLGNNDYAFIYHFDERFGDEFSDQIERYGLREVDLNG